MSFGNHRIRVVLLDIEGTITPIDFVHKVLFSYFRKHVLAYLETQLESSDEETEADVQAILKIPLTTTGASDLSPLSLDVTRPENRGPIVEAVMSRISILMDENRKDPPLKRMQGHVWKSGFESKELESEIYSDVLQAFDRWQSLQTPIFIYSSGSINAQKLLFTYTKKGSLLSYIAGYFDTSIGHKVCASSYQEIQKSIVKQLGPTFSDLAANEILFGTDNIKEAQAAKEACMSVFLSVRQGNEPLVAGHDFEEVDDFGKLWTLYKF